ncbi:hypothetical protein D9M69_675760 [compost metagenome]
MVGSRIIIIADILHYCRFLNRVARNIVGGQLIRNDNVFDNWVRSPSLVHINHVFGNAVVIDLIVNKVFIGRQRTGAGIACCSDKIIVEISNQYQVFRIIASSVKNHL